MLAPGNGLEEDGIALVHVQKAIKKEAAADLNKLLIMSELFYPVD